MSGPEEGSVVCVIAWGGVFLCRWKVERHRCAGPQHPLPCFHSGCRTPWTGSPPPPQGQPSVEAPPAGPAAVDAVDADVAKQRAEMDEDFLEMVLELDHLWTGGAVSNAASAAYDEHLGGARSADEA